MDAIECIKTRRSIRKFKEKPVSDKLIKQILEAGMFAPSAGNMQPWHFVVITDQAIKEEIPKFSPNAHMAKTAPAAIMVCAETKQEKFPGYWVMDCSAAVENMLLACHALKLGAVWTGIFPREERVANFKKHFSLPDHIIPLCLIIVGYPDQKIPKEDRWKEEKIHYDKW
jgi:nitroreductase